MLCDIRNSTLLEFHFLFAIYRRWRWTFYIDDRLLPQLLNFGDLGLCRSRRQMGAPVAVSLCTSLSPLARLLRSSPPLIEISILLAEICSFWLLERGRSS